LHHADPHVGTHHDGAGGFLDHHHGGVIGFHPQILQRGQGVDRVAAAEVERDGALIGGAGDRSDGVVDRGGDAPGRSKVRVAQAEPQRTGLVQLVGDLALNCGAVGDAPGGGNAAGD
jgi:hypothetical protein